MPNSNVNNSCMRGTWIIIVLALFSLLARSSSAHDTNAERIQPWPENPRYWQYKGQPVILLGGSKTDHIFLLDDLEPHLDEIQEVGANYVRCTMSQREGLDLKAHKLLPNGKFDLDQWNEEYWKRFSNMLKWTAERDIIVQIEVWDRFDYAARNWENSPWKPSNNVNYTSEQSGLAQSYPESAYYHSQPFFQTIPGMKQYQKQYDLIRRHQESFVEKMLSYSLPFGNVLYCMNNETASPAEWGRYWIEFINARASEKGVTVCTTDMFDDAYQGDKAKLTPFVFNDPEHYTFADISQVNSRNFDQVHWDQLLWNLEQVNKTYPRPCNHTKIYGSGYTTFGTGGPEDGIERFWRNILGGSASARFHRPDGGNGLNDFAKASIQAARLLEQRIKFWDITPHMELISDRAPNEAYLAAKPGERYAVYFTNGGSVKLDLSGAPGTYNITWISVSMGRVVETSEKGGDRLMDATIEGGGVVPLSAPYKGGWVAAIMKK